MADGIEDLIDTEPPGVVAGLTREEREDEFFRLLGQGCTVREAAASVAIPFQVLYRKRTANPAFGKRWEDAQRIVLPQLEREAHRRALKGSDKLLMFLLQSYDPARFRHQQSIDLTNSDGTLRAQPEDSDAAARTETLLAMARMRKASRELQDLL